MLSMFHFDSSWFCFHYSRVLRVLRVMTKVKVKQNIYAIANDEKLTVSIQLNSNQLEFQQWMYMDWLMTYTTVELLIGMDLISDHESLIIGKWNWNENIELVGHDDVNVKMGGKVTVALAQACCW